MPKPESELRAFVRRCVTLVDEELNRLLPEEGEEPSLLHQAVRHSVFAGGKRFRPALAMAVGDAFGIEAEKLATVGASIEMIHTYSLIHDDLPAMDDDDLRRGRATCHRKYGEATAILAGDVLQTMAFHALARDTKIEAGVRLKVIAEIARAAGSPEGMVAGQQMDLEGEGRDVSAEELERIHQNKTGAMIQASVRCGALVGRATDNELTALTDYASHLGLLFQITDDLLDVTQTTDVLGKTAGKDETVEKATYPSLFGTDKTREMALEVHTGALEALRRAEKGGLLREIADYVLDRRK